MIRRTSNPAAKDFPNYGGRGIKVCERWQDFSNFHADMGDRPEGHSLDRIDNDGDYCPENCRWATATEQTRNRRNTIHLTISGETKTLVEWSVVSGLNYQTIKDRLRRGWNPGDCLKPV